jgi:hypothetical protein
MLLGKISPVLSLVKQDSLFNPTPEFTTASYMSAVASPYILGAHKVNFRVTYGECIFEGTKIIDFKQIHSDSVELSGEDIESWGTDDTVILEIIAEKQGTSIVEVVDVELENGRFF